MTKIAKKMWSQDGTSPTTWRFHINDILEPPPQILNQALLPRNHPKYQELEESIKACPYRGMTGGIFAVFGVEPEVFNPLRMIAGNLMLYYLSIIYLLFKFFSLVEYFSRYKNICLFFGF